MLTETCHIVISMYLQMSTSVKEVKFVQIEGHKQPEVSNNLNIIEVAYVHSNGINYLTRSIVLSCHYVAPGSRTKYKVSQ